MRDDPNRESADDESLSALYASTRDAAHTPLPGADIDARILAAARDATQPSWAPWRTARWASAAVLVLAVGVLWQAQRTGVVTSPTAAEAPQPARQRNAPLSDSPGMQMRGPATPAAFGASPLEREEAAPPAAKSEAVAEREMRKQAEHDESASADADLREPSVTLDAAAGVVGALAAPAPATLPAKDPQQEITTEQQLDAIRALLAAGNREQARAALLELREAEPSITLDAQLQTLLQTPPTD